MNDAQYFGLAVLGFVANGQNGYHVPAATSADVKTVIVMVRNLLFAIEDFPFLGGLGMSSLVAFLGTAKMVPRSSDGISLRTRPTKQCPLSAPSVRTVSGLSGRVKSPSPRAAVKCPSRNRQKQRRYVPRSSDRCRPFPSGGRPFAG